MYERMLDKERRPSFEDLAAHCEGGAARFIALSAFLRETYGTERAISFPYGNRYGWCAAHRIQKKLICNIFAERGAFTVMLRLSNAQFDKLYESLSARGRELIDNKYPCGDGGWLHYRALNDEDLSDIRLLLSEKCSRRGPS